MDDQLVFDWNDEAQLKENLKKWAYNDDLILLEQDEDLLFLDIKWTKYVYDFMFDANCIKREYIINNFLEFIRQAFLNRKASDIKQIEDLFIKDMLSFTLPQKDKLLDECIEYFYSCKAIYYNSEVITFDQAKVIGKLLLNGLTNKSQISEPVITPKGNFQVSSVSSVMRYLCIDRISGDYKYYHHEPCV